MVDSAFSEWDKAAMFKSLRQFETSYEAPSPLAVAANDVLSSDANLSGLLIIPAHHGVVMIA